MTPWAPSSWHLVCGAEGRLPWRLALQGFAALAHLIGGEGSLPMAANLIKPCHTRQNSDDFPGAELAVSSQTILMRQGPLQVVQA